MSYLINFISCRDLKTILFISFFIKYHFKSLWVRYFQLNGDICQQVLHVRHDMVFACATRTFRQKSQLCARTSLLLFTSNNQRLEECFPCVLFLYDWYLHVFLAENLQQTRSEPLRFEIHYKFILSGWRRISTSMRSRLAVSVLRKWRPRPEMIFPAPWANYRYLLGIVIGQSNYFGGIGFLTVVWKPPNSQASVYERGTCKICWTLHPHLASQQRQGGTWNCPSPCPSENACSTWYVHDLPRSINFPIFQWVRVVDVTE